MFPNYRVVVDAAADTTTITPATHGWEAELDARAGAVLARWYQAGSVSVSDSAEEQLEKLCRGRGWLLPDGRLDATVDVPSPGPVLSRLQVELTLKCNLACSYCYSESGVGRAEALSLPEVRRILRDARALGVTWLDLTGGEFFLYPHWREVLHEARSLGLVVSIHTNGLLLTDRNVSALVAAGVRWVQVSADSAEGDVHDVVRGRRGAHRRLVEGIRRSQRAGLPIKVMLMAHQRNKNDIGASVRWFRTELGTEVAVDRIISAGGERKNPVGLTAKEFYEVVVPQIAGAATTRVCQSAAATGDTKPYCGVAHDFLYVTAEGEFALCPTMTSRDDAIFAGPSVRTTSLAEAWLRSPYFNHYRGSNCGNANSRQCPAASDCRGGCRSNAYLEVGQVDSPDPVSCNLHKNSTTVFIDFPVRYREGSFGVV